MPALVQIIGPSASGKSSLLPFISATRRFAVVDTDQAYQRYTHANIFDDFIKLGSLKLREKYFRLYTSIVQETTRDTIFLVGGTLPLYDQFWAYTRRANIFSLALSCSPQTSLARIEASKNAEVHAAHPLLVLDRKFDIAGLLYSYRQVYYQPADATINTNTLSPKQIALAVTDCIYGRFGFL